MLRAGPKNSTTPILMFYFVDPKQPEQVWVFIWIPVTLLLWLISWILIKIDLRVMSNNLLLLFNE